MKEVLLALGFKTGPLKGESYFFRHPDGRTTTVLHHLGKASPDP